MGVTDTENNLRLGWPVFVMQMFGRTRLYSMEFVLLPQFVFLIFPSLANFSTIANVVTSLPFIAVGFSGARRLVAGSGRNAGRGRPKAPFVAFVLSLILVGAGSIFYHLFPSTEHLLWDRLPIAVCLAAFACAIADTGGPDSRIGSALLLPVLAVSVSSVLYWHVSVTRGHENLFPYAAVQVCTVLWAGVSFFGRRTRHAGAGDLRWALAAYALGRIVELFQQQIYNKLGLDLGHPLKHLLVALAVFLIVRALASSADEQPETVPLRLETVPSD